MPSWASTLQVFVLCVSNTHGKAEILQYDTQKIKDMYFDGGDSETMAKKSIMGALTLYLDFINLFVMLLRFFGDKRE
jgi:FtsH-binding integral membrane protein